jgi:hypothetical protein
MKKSIYQQFLEANLALTKNGVPSSGRIVHMADTFRKQLEPFTAKTGKFIDGVEIHIVPKSELPNNTEFVISHPEVRHG